MIILYDCKSVCYLQFVILCIDMEDHASNPFKAVLCDI